MYCIYAQYIIQITELYTIFGVNIVERIGHSYETDHYMLAGAIIVNKPS